MEYLSKEEIRRLFKTVYNQNRTHHLIMLVGFWHGLRVSEVVGDKRQGIPGLYGKDIVDGQIAVARLKKSKPTIQPVRACADPLFDERPILDLASRNPGKLFSITRQRVDQLMKKYCSDAGIHPSKAHYHVLKHSIAMALFDDAKSLGQVQSYLGHKAASSTLTYLYESDASKAHKVVKDMKI